MAKNGEPVKALVTAPYTIVYSDPEALPVIGDDAKKV
jgi:hypothetical protein